MLQSPDQLHRSRDTSVMLRSGLNLIQQGLSIYSNDLRLILGNRQFKTMFGLPDHLVEPGASFSDTIRFVAENGDYGDVGDIDAFVKAREKQALAFEQHYVERQRANGRWVSVEGGPLRQGGWVTVYTDITNVKNQEEMLRSQSDELSGKLFDRSEELARTNRALEATITQLHETQQHLEAAEARIRLAAETTPAHIARMDPQERYTYSNQRLPMAPANGVTDIVGHKARDVLGAEVYANIAPGLHSALAGEAKVVEFTESQKGRQIRVAFTPDTNAADDVTGVYVLSMDVTQSQHGKIKDATDIATFGPWIARLDILELQHEDGKKTPLTLSEATLLKILLTEANRLLTRDHIFEAPDIKRGSDRALDVRISRLRQKLRDDPKSPQLLRTIYGAGYIFTADVTWQGKP